MIVALDFFTVPTMTFKHYCPVKYFVKIGKSIDISGIEGVRPKNDLNGKRGKLGQKRVGDRGGIMVDECWPDRVLATHRLPFP